MQFRHEVKYEINGLDMMIIRQRLKNIMQPDIHSVNGAYKIRSLYFDNYNDKALLEKINGVNTREKYRIRMYNNDTSLIRLERKFKTNGLGYKNTALLTKEQAKDIINGDILFLRDSESEVLNDFYRKLITENLKPKVIVDYTREPFVYPAGNVRVTLDYNIRTGLCCTDFLNPDCITVPIRETVNLIEIKWDNFLPDAVKAAIAVENRQSGAFSKYAACRMYD